MAYPLFLGEALQLSVIEIALAQQAVACLDFDLAAHDATTVFHPEFSINGLNVCIAILGS